ncbi:MAG: DUF4249 domain-containing protein [Bacteroidales bacterium]|nr:DUF4249 domain-containing protein [Bacteroidales bacterium]
MQKNKLRNIHWFVIVGLFLMINSSCVEEYTPELNLDNNHFLVVDGKISNFPGPYTIKLSYSSSILDTLFIPVSSATISISDDQGNTEILKEEDLGVYKTSANGIQGVIGRSYKVNIHLNNGKDYESEFEQLLNPIDVEDVYYKEEWQYAQNESESDQEGFKFYVKTKVTNTSNVYFFWEVEETYEYHSVANILYFYDGTIISEGISNNFGLKPMENIYSLYYCWKTQTLAENIIYSLENTNIQDIHQLPLHFVPYGDKRLRFGYNILLKQYVISEKAYYFLNELKKQNENQGSLFTTQPFQIRGNIFNSQNPSEIVLGYFTVASGSYGPRIQVKAPWRRYEETICYTDTSLSSIQNRIINSKIEDWPIYFTDFPFENPFVPNEFFYVFSYVAPTCLDCTKRGGYTHKPDFWQE